MGFFIIGEVDLYAGFCIRRSGDSHSSRPAIAHWLEQPTRLHTRATQCGSLFGLAPGGVYLATNCYQSHGALLPHPFSLTCAPSEEMRPSAVFSLLHLSWARAPQTLSGTLLYGARTFLPSASLPKDFNVSFPKDLNVSLPKDINKAAATQSAPRADCIEFRVKCLARSQK